MKNGMKNRAKEYIQSMGEITLTAFKDKMGGNEAVLWNLVAEGFAEHTVGFLFRYTGKAEKSPSPKEKGGANISLVEEIFGPTKGSALDPNKTLKKAQSTLDDEDDWLFDDDDTASHKNENADDDDTEKAIKEIKDITLIDLFSDTEKESDGENDDDDDTALQEPREIDLEELRLRRELAKTAMSFGCGGKFKKDGKDYVYALGITYLDDTPMQFKLFYEGKMMLSDCGLTHRFMSKYFDLENDKVSAQMQRIMKDYSLELRTAKGERELCIEITDTNNAFAAFLWLFSAIERISNIQEEVGENNE